MDISFKYEDFQLNFLEGHVKAAYFPRELIINDLKNEERKPLKVKGNRLSVYPKVSSPNQIKYLIVYPSMAKNALGFPIKFILRELFGFRVCRLRSAISRP